MNATTMQSHNQAGATTASSDPILAAAALMTPLVTAFTAVGLTRHQAAVRANAIAIEKTGVDFLKLAGLDPAGHLRNESEQVIAYIGNAKAYAANSEWGPALTHGFMPHDFLYRLMKLSPDDFGVVMCEAVMRGKVEPVPGEEMPVDCHGFCYRLPTTPGSAK